VYGSLAGGSSPASLVESVDQVALRAVALADVADELVEGVLVLQAREQRPGLLEPLDGAGVGVVVARADRRLDLGQVHLERIAGMLALAGAREREPQVSAAASFLRLAPGLLVVVLPEQGGDELGAVASTRGRMRA
jgi:hypothetical protein